MTSQPTKRFLALLVSAALLASLSVATVASPASAAKPRCQGKVATIVGTQKADILKGTAKRDIIVAKGGDDRIYAMGGNDIICAGGGNDRVFGGQGIDRLWGQLGHDKLFGNAGPDFLAGQVGNDTLVGGIGVDTCFQGTGSGPVSRCERPVPPSVAVPVAPRPPEPKILAIAYTDLNRNGIFDGGDVMVSRIVDTNADGTVSEGDTIEMGMYPTRLDPATSDHFAAWGVKSHVIVEVQTADPWEWAVWTETDTVLHSWYSEATDTGEQYDEYHERGPGGTSELEDLLPVGADDSLEFNTGSPSNPTIAIPDDSAPGAGDDYFIDVIFYP